jgi:hypothetical protein
MTLMAQPLSSEELLHALEDLATPELEQIISRLIVLKAERTAPHLPQRESELLLRINQGLPDDTTRRYRELISRRRTRSLSPEEHEELLRLTDRAEALEADRLVHLAELARLRHTSLSRLMEELGIQPAPDA